MLKISIFPLNSHKMGISLVESTKLSFGQFLSTTLLDAPRAPIRHDGEFSCSLPNRLHYEPCPSVPLSVSLSTRLSTPCGRLTLETRKPS